MYKFMLQLLLISGLRSLSAEQFLRSHIIQTQDNEGTLPGAYPSTSKPHDHEEPSSKPKNKPNILSTRSIPKYAYWEGDRLTFRFTAVNFFNSSHPMSSKLQSCLDANVQDTKSIFFAD